MTSQLTRPHRRPDTGTPAGPDGPTSSPSEYAYLMPLLRRFADLPRSDPEARALREELILGFLPVVEHIAHRQGRGYPGGIEDLVQVGTVGLINALDRWDPELARGEFLSYLVPCVRGEILRHFRDRTWTMRVPRRLKDLSVAINAASGPLSQTLGRAPRPTELAAHLDVPVAEIIDALDARAGYHAAPLDAVDPETGTPLLDLLGELDGELAAVEYRHALRPLLEQLPERTRTILMLRFFAEMTQTQIAAQVGISQMHVSRLLSQTLAELRRGLFGESDEAAG